MDFSSKKVSDLRKELKSRGLSIIGTKQDLITRLEQHVPNEKAEDSPNDDTLLDDDEILGEDSNSNDGNNGNGKVESDSVLASPASSVVSTTTSTPNTPVVPATAAVAATAVTTTSGSGSPPRKIKLNRTPITMGSPAAMAAASVAPSDPKSVIKTSVKASAEEIAKLRQIKFGSAAPTAPVPSAAVMTDVLKKRSERFGATAGTTTGKIALKSPDEVKMAKRKERFAEPVDEIEAKKMKRAIRFN